MRPTSKTAVFGSCWVKPNVASERWTSLTWLIEGSRISRATSEQMSIVSGASFTETPNALSV